MTRFVIRSSELPARPAPERTVAAKTSSGSCMWRPAPERTVAAHTSSGSSMWRPVSERAVAAHTSSGSSMWRPAPERTVAAHTSSGSSMWRPAPERTVAASWSSMWRSVPERTLATRSDSLSPVVSLRPVRVGPIVPTSSGTSSVLFSVSSQSFVAITTRPIFHERYPMRKVTGVTLTVFLWGRAAQRKHAR